MARRGRYPSLKDWAVALENAAQALVAERVRAALRASCPVSAEPCPEHGPECACVTYGMFRSHFRWAEHDPLHLADRLVGTMVPRRP